MTLRRKFSSVTLFFAIFAIIAMIAPASQAQTTLLHYWSFNNLTPSPAGADTFPHIPLLKASYSLIDTNKAYMLYTFDSGTSVKSMDSAWIDGVSGTTLNAQQGTAAGNSLRVRNPCDFSQLWFFIPSTGYQGITLSYALESSSVKSGPEVTVFAYSVDSGLHWKTSGLTVNGKSVDTLKDTASVYQGSSFGLVTVGFGTDSTVNNNSNLVLRISFKRDDTGAVAGTSGNERIDNVAVQAGPVPRTISVLNPSLGDTLISGQRDTVTFSTTGKISKMKWVFYSLDSGRTWTSEGMDTTSSFLWTVPQVVNPVRYAMIAVEDSAATIGYSTPFVILPVRYFPPDANLIYYWHFNGFSGAYSFPGVPNIPVDYSAEANSNANITYLLTPGSSTAGLVQDASGTTLNQQMLYPAGRSLEVDNPSNGSELRLYIPTPNRKNIAVNFALQTTDGTTGPLVTSYDFSLDSGLTWQTTGLRRLSDSINGAGYTNGNWGLISVDLSKDSLTSDNPKLVFRLRFSGNNSGSRGLVRIDNVTVTGQVGQIVIVGAPVLVQYWNFNSLATAYHVPDVPNVKADFSLLDTNKAFLEYYLEPGTSNSYLGYIDNVAGGDTSNLRNGAVAGQALRVRNPVDSIELRWHIPSTGYKNLVVKFVVESSSTGSGDSTQIYSYSVDGGTTWKSTALTVNGANVDTMDVTHNPQMQGSNWGLVTITFGDDASVNNNPNLIFRITYRGNTALTSGNNRYDDFTLDGIPGVSSQISPLIHYWHFDSLNTAYHNPGIPPIAADYSAISPNPAKILYVLDSGTSSTYAGYLDNVAGDTTNSQLGAVAGQALRVRNPTDSMELHFVIPTTGYNNISFQYALESSSTNSGQLEELFDYSPDGGTTWKSSPLTVNGANVDTLDVTNPIFQGTSWGLVTIGFGSDTSVNNNPNLIFRIKFWGNTSKTSGNNRFDNVTVEGTPLGQPAPPIPASIAVLTPSKGDTLFSGTHHTISFSVSGAIGASRAIDYSTDNGITWSTITFGLTGTSYDWTVPALGSLHARIRVRDFEGHSGISNPFIVLVPGSVRAIQLSSSHITTGDSVEIIWSTTGYVGNSVDLDVSYDGKISWTPIVHGDVFGSNTSYPWIAPQTADSNVVIRATFAEGAIGYSAPFNIYPPVSEEVIEQPSQVLRYWPNPANTVLNISNPIAENCSIAIFDATGRKVLKTTAAAGDNCSIDISHLLPGAYFVTLTGDKTEYRCRFIVAR